MTTESRELALYATNEGPLYRSMSQPIIENLRRKIARGTYDADRALRAWRSVADRAAQLYTKEFDHKPRTSFGCFTPADRQEAAKEIAQYYQDHLFDGD